MADLLLSNGSTQLIEISSDGVEVDVDINRRNLKESLVKSAGSNDDNVIISYGNGTPDENTPGKIYIQI